MVPPDSAFHCQTRSSNSSRPRSRRSSAFFGELAFDDHLGGDAGVVGAGEPEGDVAAHAVPADGDVDLGVLQHVAHVEGAGDVGRRDDERECRLAGLDIRRGRCRIRSTTEPNAAQTAGARRLFQFAWEVFSLAWRAKDTSGLSVALRWVGKGSGGIGDWRLGPIQHVGGRCGGCAGELYLHWLTLQSPFGYFEGGETVGCGEDFFIRIN